VVAASLLSRAPYTVVNARMNSGEMARSERKVARHLIGAEIDTTSAGTFRALADSKVAALDFA